MSNWNHQQARRPYGYHSNNAADAVRLASRPDGSSIGSRRHPSESDRFQNVGGLASTMMGVQHRGSNYQQQQQQPHPHQSYTGGNRYPFFDNHRLQSNSSSFCGAGFDSAPPSDAMDGTLTAVYSRGDINGK